MYKFSHTQQNLNQRSVWARLRVDVNFIWMTVYNLVWPKRPSTSCIWSPEEACQQRAGHDWGWRGRPRNPLPTSYSSHSQGALNPFELTSLCPSLTLLLAVTSKPHDSQLTPHFPHFIPGKVLYSFTVLCCWECKIPEDTFPWAMRHCSSSWPTTDTELHCTGNGERLPEILKIPTYTPAFHWALQCKQKNQIFPWPSVMISFVEE